MLSPPTPRRVSRHFWKSGVRAGQESSVPHVGNNERSNCFFRFITECPHSTEPAPCNVSQEDFRSHTLDLFNNYCNCRIQGSAARQSLLRNSDCGPCGGRKYSRECSIQPRSGDVVLDPGVSPGQSGKYARAAERRSWFRKSLFSAACKACFLRLARRSLRNRFPFWFAVVTLVFLLC